MTETWRPVIGWEEAYEVSDLGRVRSVARIVSNGRGTRRTPARVRRANAHRGGYRMVCLTFGGRRKNATVHGLVAAAFLGERPDGADVRHLDGDPTNNTLANLSYGTRAENMSDAIEHGRTPKGSANARAKVDEQAVLEIRRRYRPNENISELAAEFGLSKSGVYAIATRQTWAWLEEEK